MEHRTGKHVKEQSYTGMTVKIEVDEASTALVDIQMNVTHFKQECVKSEPALLVKEDIMKKSREGGNEQQCVQDIKTATGASSVNGACCTRLDGLLNVKYELSDNNVRPTVLQHMDMHNTINKDPSASEENTIVDGYNKPMTCSRVKKETIQNKLRDSSSGHFMCDCCLKKFHSSSKLVSHLQYMTRYKSYRCKLCNKNFKSRLHSTRHTKQLHGEEHKSQQTQTYRCDMCLKVFKSKKYLWYHHRHVHGKGTHKCTQCDKEFKCKAYLGKHVRNTHSKEQSKCDICKKIYKSPTSLHYHISVYHRKKSAGSQAYNYTCDYCQKSFWRKQALVQHIKTVHGARIHRCYKCKKKYKTRHHLEQHEIAVHCGVQHECEVCHVLFTSRYLLRTHVKKTHGLNDIQVKSNSGSQEIHDPHLIAGDTSAVVGTGSQQHDVKSEPGNAELELGPVVFQHMDSNYRPLKKEP